MSTERTPQKRKTANLASDLLKRIILQENGDENEVKVKIIGQEDNIDNSGSEWYPTNSVDSSRSERSRSISPNTSSINNLTRFSNIKMPENHLDLGLPVFLAESDEVNPCLKMPEPRIFVINNTPTDPHSYAKQEKWPEDAVFALLKLIKECFLKFHGVIRTRDLWDKIVKGLKDQNYNFTRCEIQRKWSSLKDTYRKREKRSTNSNLQFWSFQAIMEELLSDDKIFQATTSSELHLENDMNEQSNDFISMSSKSPVLFQNEPCTPSKSTDLSSGSASPASSIATPSENLSPREPLSSIVRPHSAPPQECEFNASELSKRASCKSNSSRSSHCINPSTPSTQNYPNDKHSHASALALCIEEMMEQKERHHNQLVEMMQRHHKEKTAERRELTQILLKYVKETDDKAGNLPAFLEF